MERIRERQKKDEGCFVFGSDGVFFCVLIYGGFMLICIDDCMIFCCFNDGLCGFNGGLCGGCVVDDEEKKHAKKKM